MADKSNGESSTASTSGNVADVHSVCIEVFYNFFDELKAITDVESLIPEFQKLSIITEQECSMIKTLSSGVEKMVALLENVSLPLEDQHTENFAGLLWILKVYGNEATKQLRDAMKKEINRLLPSGNSSLFDVPEEESEPGEIVLKQNLSNPDLSDIWNIKNFKFHMPLRKLPPHYVFRHQLMTDIEECICSSAHVKREFCTTLMLTGIGGFGKTTLVLALIEQPKVKEMFANGFVFIELGPQANDPGNILKHQYCLLTNQKFQYENITNVESKIRYLTGIFDDLLVIIDDVWEVEDAIPIVRAFSNCKIILTTRKDDIDIPTKKKIVIGPMTSEEAFKLVTKGILRGRTLSLQESRFLHKIIKNTHLWPLLLSLIRGQVYHKVIIANMSCHDALQSVKDNLFGNGLTAFDMNILGEEYANRNLSVQACLEVSLRLLPPSKLDRYTSLILFTGVGGSVPKSIVHCVWRVNEQEASKTIDELQSHGLISTKQDYMLPHYSRIEIYVEIHDVLSQFHMGSLKSEKVVDLSPFMMLDIQKLITEYTALVFKQPYKVTVLKLLSKKDFLKYNKEKLENIVIPYSLKNINMHAIHDPHLLMEILHNVQTKLVEKKMAFKLEVSLFTKINDLLRKCEELVKDAPKLSGKCNRQFQKCFCEKKFENLIATVQKCYETEFIKSITYNAVETLKKIIVCCDISVQDSLKRFSKEIQVLTHEYHPITIEKLPRLKLQATLHKRIQEALTINPRDIDNVYQYIASGGFVDDETLLSDNCRIKRLEIGPEFATDFS